MLLLRTISAGGISSRRAWLCWGRRLRLGDISMHAGLDCPGISQREARFCGAEGRTLRRGRRAGTNGAQSASRPAAVNQRQAVAFEAPWTRNGSRPAGEQVRRSPAGRLRHSLAILNPRAISKLSFAKLVRPRAITTTVSRTPRPAGAPGVTSPTSQATETTPTMSG